MIVCELIGFLSKMFADYGDCDLCMEVEMTDV